MSVEASDRLEHILNETIYLLEIKKGIACQADIEENETLKRSVVRSLEIIGEAAKTLPKDILQNRSNIDWRNISRMRDNLIHRYFKVDYKVVWAVIQDKIPELNAEVQKMLGQIYRTEYLTYRQQVGGELQAESIDPQVARLILQEYTPKFENVARAKIERILSHSERAIELKSNSNSVESYIKQIVESLTSDS